MYSMDFRINGARKLICTPLPAGTRYRAWKCLETNKVVSKFYHIARRRVVGASCQAKKLLTTVSSKKIYILPKREWYGHGSGRDGWTLWR